jgi:carbamoyltransferase
MYDAAKVMGLAAYGDPNVYRQQLASVIQVSEESYEVGLRALGFPSFDAPGFEPLLGPARKEEEEILPRHMDFAATLQEVTDAAVVALLRRLKRSVKADRLCVVGGVALNCVTNELIRKANSYSEIFIPSAPHDAGTAIGAALAVYCAERRTKPPPSGATPYLGPQFDERKVLAAIKEAGLVPRRTKNAAREAADMIADGNIVGWFQGPWSSGRAPSATGRCLPIRAGPIHGPSSIAWSSTAKIFGRSRPVCLPNAPTNGSKSGRIWPATNTCCSPVQQKRGVANAFRP